MKKILILFIIILSIPFTLFSNSSRTEISGKITDAKTHEPIPGASVYIPDLKTGTISDLNGVFHLENLPKIKILIQIASVSYKSIITTIDLNSTVEFNFEMEYVATELNEVVITGLSKAAEQKRIPTPVTIVPKTELMQNASSNIIDALANQPGISQITTGSGISKPVIRGLGYNRVVTVQDDIRQEGQQWGDEHGIEIDPYEVNKVEILKGPASLSYGSDAIAGVIHLISAPSLPEGKIGGDVISEYQTNNGLIGYSFHLGGNQKGFVWNTRYSNRLSHSYKNIYDGYVFNSGFREEAGSLLMGFDKSWGFSHLELSAYRLIPGIIEGERDSATGKFTRLNYNNGSDEQVIVTDKECKSYNLFVPFQKVYHYKAVFNSNIILGQGNAKATIGFQQNRRQEYGESDASYGLYFLLNTVNYDFRYNLPEIDNFNISFGVNGMKQDSYNKGTEFLVPEYNLFDYGVFTIINKSMGKIDVSGGLRFDSRTEGGRSLFLNANGEEVSEDVANRIQKFSAFNSTFTGFSGSLGATWQITDNLFTKLNFSRGYRAPNIGELGSNGKHEGTLRYEIGDPSLKPENSFQIDYTMGLNTEHISAEITAFSNKIDNFIFLRKLSNSEGSDSIIEDNTAFKYVSGDAYLFGGEARFDIHPHPYDWLHFENSFSFVNTCLLNQPDSSKYLPLTPAPKWQSSIRVNVADVFQNLHNFYCKVSLDKYFDQNRIFSAYGTETKTPGYTLINLGIGGELRGKSRQICSVYMGVSNITNKAYQSHLSRLKYATENYATGRTGVYNMGRNFTFKVSVPVD